MVSALELAAGAAAAGAANRAPEAFDEMVTGQGTIRPHWQPLMAAMSGLGASGLTERAERGRQFLEDEGVTYNLYELPNQPARGREIAPPLPEQRPWRLDPVPVLLSGEEWAQIEAGLIQRATLIDLVLRDLYGPMELLQGRQYPPALVFGHGEFLRPARLTDRRPQRMLQHYAAELVRGSDGTWRVIADRTQAPAGAGYALQNRRVMSRLFGQAMRECRARPLNAFFEYWQADLLSRGSRTSDNPRVALLTPGPYNEAYFEHIYLARELGATLVEGADLTTRDDRVMIKTLGGLEAVDTLVRRVDGEWCDPLELRVQSALGAVGLLQAARSGQIAVCNALGSGLAEQPAMLAFLPKLCERLLGEALRMPSIATWWCGQRYALAEVEAAFDSLVVRSAFDRNSAPVTVRDLADVEREALLRRLRQRPAQFVAHERIVPSVSPGLGENGLNPQPVLLRVQVVADGDGYVVMPGGLARVPSESDPFRAVLQRGGVNKDVWVVASEPVATVIRGAASRQRLPLRRSSRTLQSRVADDLFWFGRSFERLDDGARLLRSVLTRLVGEYASARDLAEAAVLARGLAASGIVDPVVSNAPPHSALFASAMLEACSPARALGQTLESLERLTIVSRHRFSADMWRMLNHLLGELKQARSLASRDADSMIDYCDQMIRAAAAIGGMLAENMTRGTGWRFLDLGRRLERGIYICRTLSAACTVLEQNRDSAFRVALEANDSSLTYRRRYRTALQAAAVLDLLLLDLSNPHALGYQLQAIAQHLDMLPANAAAPTAGATLALGEPFAAMVAELDGETAAAMAEPGMTLADRLGRDLERTTRALMSFSDMLSRAYFSHVQVTHPLGYGT